MKKPDYKIIFKEYFNAPINEPILINLPEYKYLIINGKGHPQDKDFQDAITPLFATSFIAKFLLKKINPENDYVVLPMEVKWFIDRDKHGKDRYSWIMMLMQPPFMSLDIIKKAICEADFRSKKKRRDLKRLNDIRFVTIKEGLCAQIIHKGPYGDPMEQTFSLLKKYVEEQDYEYEKESHDIYFNDARRISSEKLKTLIRARVHKKSNPGFCNYNEIIKDILE